MSDKIDAVTVSTPDHHHFPAAMMAVQRGKHVYVEKPLTHSVGEARALRGVAKAVSQLSQTEALYVLTTAVESLENQLPKEEADGSAS